MYFCFSTHYLIIKVNLMKILLTNVVHCWKISEKVINSKDNEGRGDAKGDQLGCTKAHLMIKAGVRTFFLQFWICNTSNFAHKASRINILYKAQLQVCIKCHHTVPKFQFLAAKSLGIRHETMNCIRSLH